MRPSSLLALFLAVASACFAPRLAAAAQQAGTVVVTMSGFRNDRGFMRISLFPSPKGYPGKHQLALRSGTGRITSGKATFLFENVPHGSYAIAVLHDENGNGKMDTNWMGIPQEGAGASNDARARLGPPKFEDARFVLGEAQRRIQITIRYP